MTEYWIISRTSVMVKHWNNQRSCVAGAWKMDIVHHRTALHYSTRWQLHKESTKCLYTWHCPLGKKTPEQGSKVPLSKKKPLIKLNWTPTFKQQAKVHLFFDCLVAYAF